MIKNIAITGSSGFIGSYFTKNITDFNIREVDLLVQKVDEVDFSGIDSVLHLAAHVHQMNSKDDTQYFIVNRDLAFETAKRAKLHGVRQFILMSTVKVYGESNSNSIPWNENSECKPLDAYGKSKFEAEKKINELADDTFQVAIIRSPLVYGAGVKANMFNLIRLIDKYPIIPFKDISNKRSMVYIGNLAAYIKQIMANNASGVFIPADPDSLSTYHLSQLIAKSLNKTPFFFKIPKFLLKAIKQIKPAIYSRLFDSLVVDNRRTNEILQILPPFPSEEGIAVMVNWYIVVDK